MFDTLTALLPALLPASFVVGSWVCCFLQIAGFFGHTIRWRGRQYRLFSDGRLEPLLP